jgi:hypothetical protein
LRQVIFLGHAIVHPSPIPIEKEPWGGLVFSGFEIGKEHDVQGGTLLAYKNLNGYLGG